jgi:hypothetical protein
MKFNSLILEKEGGTEVRHAPVKVDEEALDPERPVEQRRRPGSAVLPRQNLFLVGGYPVPVLGADHDVTVVDRRRQQRVG